MNQIVVKSTVVEALHKKYKKHKRLLPKKQSAGSSYCISMKSRVEENIV